MKKFIYVSVNSERAMYSSNFSLILS